MFGHDDEKKDDQSATPVISPAPDELVTPDASPPAAPAVPAANDNAAVTSDFDTSKISLPGAINDAPATSAPVPAPASVADDKKDDSDDLLPSHNGAVDNDLLSLKKDALQELSPLVDELDQTPEEKFKTMMMMIQAADDQSLLKPAHEAAKQIKDDKIRAQALLDIINEINYFTQQSQN